MGDQPNWAEIVNAAAAVITALIAIPAGAFLLIDRRRAKARALSLRPSRPAEGLTQIIATFTPEDFDAAVAKLKSPRGAALVERESYTSLGPDGRLVFSAPEAGSRCLTVKMDRWNHNASGEISAILGVIGVPPSAAIKLKVTITTSPKVRRIVWKTATLSATH
jgi:hypothetical protein